MRRPACPPPIVRRADTPLRELRQLHPDQAGDVARIGRTLRENLCDLRRRQLHMRAQYRRDWLAKIRRYRDIAILVEGRIVKPGPPTVNAPAPHTSAHHLHHIPMPVIGAAVAIFMHRASELGNHDDYGIAVGRA